MAAKLQAIAYEAYLFEPTAGGHGYGMDNRERTSRHRLDRQLSPGCGRHA
jgi:hypothetical protein